MTMGVLIIMVGGTRQRRSTEALDRAVGGTRQRHLTSLPTPIHKGIHKGGRREAPPPFVEAARSAASFMDGCVVAVQVEDFGLPKSAVGTVGQTSNMFKILPLDF